MIAPSCSGVFFSKIFKSRKDGEDRFTEKTVSELVKGCFEMGRAKTGALIVIEQDTPLQEYERTGILVGTQPAEPGDRYCAGFLRYDQRHTVRRLADPQAGPVARA